ncbi:MAG: metal ABC transporter permease [Rikenellaceae bacterium]|nr:metal ABC transporter permease [Rikenellaceae bacterium]
MEALIEILGYRFMQNALLAALFSGITCGVVGSYIVARRTVFSSGGITHASFGGIGLAYWAGINPILGATLFAVLAAVGIELGERRGGIRQDSAVGIVWSVGMALGIIFIHLTPGYTPDATGILFGNILAVNRGTIWASAVLTAVVVVAFAIWHRPIMYATFDREFAQSQGVNTAVVGYAMAVLTALTVVLSIQAVGIVLLISLLTFPATIVGLLTKDYRRIAAWSAVVAVVAGVVGLAASYRMNIPAGAATIFVLAASLITVKLLTLCFKHRPSRKA